MFLIIKKEKKKISRFLSKGMFLIIKEINRLRKEISRFLSKRMF